MRLGIYGGSFDPVHFGHLLLAESCREQCGLDQVWFIPAALSPHKQSRQPTEATKRIEMLKLAIGGHPDFRADDREVRRGGVSFTADTLAELQAEDPSRQLFFLMGADSLADLRTWKDPGRICELAIPAVVARSGSPRPDLNVLADLVSPERLAEIRKYVVQMPLIDLHSSAIRERVARGHSIRYQVPRAIEEYIRANGLYSTSGTPGSAG